MPAPSIIVAGDARWCAASASLAAALPTGRLRQFRKSRNRRIGLGPTKSNASEGGNKPKSGAAGRTLQKLLRQSHPGIVFNSHYIVEGATVFQNACKLGCKGIVSKQLGSPSNGQSGNRRLTTLRKVTFELRVILQGTSRDQL